MKKKLTNKQKMFVKEYLVDLNATQAAIRSGYSKKTAKDIACENLAKPYIAEAVAEAFDKRLEKTELSAEYVVNGLMMGAETEGRRIKATKKEGKGEKRKDVAILDEDGEEVYRLVNPLGFYRAMELLGKHLGMFKDNINHTGEINNPSGFNVISNDFKKTVGNRIPPDSEADAGDDVSSG